VKIAAEQWYPWKAEPLSGMTLRFYQMYVDASGTWVNGGTVDIDMTSHIPSTGTLARYALISIDQAGLYVITDGSTVANKAALTITDIPAVPFNNVAKWAVRLWHGQTSLILTTTDTDFIDLRFSKINATMGLVTLVGGTATVNTAKVKTNSLIFLTPQTLGTITRPAGLGVTARVDGVSFTIMSQDVTDTSDVAWEIA
jgi:hypothetical protein